VSAALARALVVKYLDPLTYCRVWLYSYGTILYRAYAPIAALNLLVKPAQTTQLLFSDLSRFWASAWLAHVARLLVARYEKVIRNVVFNLRFLRW